MVVQLFEQSKEVNLSKYSKIWNKKKERKPSGLGTLSCPSWLMAGKQVKPTCFGWNLKP